MGKFLNATKNLFRNISGKPVYINLNIVSTQACTQKCPMCNAEIEHAKHIDFFKYEDFERYVKAIKKYRFLSCTMSGGEPTIVPDMPKMLKLAVKHFPFSVSLITNLYKRTPLFEEIINTALENNVNISVSFDGFGAVADFLRGAENVSESVMKNIEWVNERKAALNSKSSLTLHSVISENNIDQIKDILKYSQEIGWNYTVAPVNNFFYQDPNDPNLPKLYYSDKLKELIELFLKQENMHQQEDFLKGTLFFLQDKAPKLCPYLKPNLRNYKIFLEPDGSVYLCDRTSLGKLDEKPLHKMFEGKAYLKSLEEYKKCQGCWLECFVSPMLYKALNYPIRKESFDLDLLDQ